MASNQPTLTAISGRFSAVFFTELLGSSVSKKIQVKPLSRSAVIGSSIGHLRSKVKKTTQAIIEVKPRIRSAILNHILKQEAGEDLILQSCKFRYIIYGGCTPARQWGRCNPGVHGYSFECYIASILEQVTLHTKKLLEHSNPQQISGQDAAPYIIGKKRELQAIAGFEAKP